MGIFNRRKKKDPLSPQPAAPEAGRKPCGPALAEIARLISYGDEAVLQEVSACTADPQAWFAAHQDRYEERGVLSGGDLELVQWLGLADILEEHGCVCERDWKDEKEDFIFFVQNLKGFREQSLVLDPAWLDGEDDIPAWCHVLAEKWSSQEVRMAAIDMDSDSYVLFPVPSGQFPALQKAAREIGRTIHYVER